MSIIRHADQTDIRGYRQIVTSAVGATTCTLWDQTIPPGGAITPHYHESEETLTFLIGTVEVTLGDQTMLVDADTTVFIPAGALHGVRNHGSEPARLIAFFPTVEPKVIYPDGSSVSVG